MKKILLFTIIALSCLTAKGQGTGPLLGKPSLKLVFDVAQTKKWDFTVDTNNMLTINGTGGTPGIRLSDFSGTGDRVLAVDADGDLVRTNFEPGAGPSFGTDNQVPYTNAGGTDFDYSSNFTHDGTTLHLGIEGVEIGTHSTGNGFQIYTYDQGSGSYVYALGSQTKSKPGITMSENGATTLYYNGAAAVTTKAGGINPTGVNFDIGESGNRWSDLFINNTLDSKFAMSDATSRTVMELGDDTSPHFATFSYFKAVSENDGYAAIAGKSGGLPWKILGSGQLQSDDPPAGSIASGTKDGFYLTQGGGFFASRDGNPVLNLRRRTSDGQIAQFRRDGTEVGSISVTTTATAYNTSSDYRLKEDLKTFDGLSLAKKIPVYNYAWKSGGRSYGVMAHELQKVIPQAVMGEKDGVDENGNPIMQGVDYSKIVPILLKSIQELEARISQLENK